MQDDLKQHTITILNFLGIEHVSVEVCPHSSPLPWTLSLKEKRTYEFVVICKCSCEVDTSLLKKLSRLLGKEIFRLNDVTGEYYYWLVGDILQEEKTNCFNTFLTLPSWLDTFLFSELNAVYQPDFKRFENNLNLSEEEICIYLGTYFPRSYAESYCIFENLFTHYEIHNAFSDLKECNILDIGSGTGGNVLGLLVAIEKFFPNLIHLNVTVVDGNSRALDTLSKIIDKFKQQTTKKVTLRIINKNIDNILSKHPSKNRHRKFEFVLSSKMINETLSNERNAYYFYVLNFLPFLSKYGLFSILDVTTRRDSLDYNPILMNFQINKALSEFEKYKSIIPIPCGLHEDKCRENCFYQQQFNITHSHKNNDKSKVAYRIITTQSLYERLYASFPNKNFIIHNDMNHPTQQKICPYCNGDVLGDGYDVNELSPQGHK